MAGVALSALAGTVLAFAPQGTAAAAPAARQSDEAGVPRIVMTAEPATVAEAAALDQAVQADSHGCSGNEVSNNSYVHVCFVRDGDKLYVKDDESNGRAAMGQIRFQDGGAVYDGFCPNSHTADSGIWVYCSVSRADEDTTVYYRGYDTADGNGDHFTSWQGESTS